VQKLKLDRAATALAVLGVAAHTAYLVTRWIAAGQIEILARERTGDVLTSMDRFWFMISHPPYTNLFDALNFVAWAMMVCYLIIERKWGLRIVGALAVALALVAMGEASLVTDKQIEPLVPRCRATGSSSTSGCSSSPTRSSRSARCARCCISSAPRRRRRSWAV